MPNENNFNIENLLKSVSNKLGKTPEELKKASETGKVNDLLGSLRPTEAQKIQKVLSDKNAANKILSSSQAQNLIKKLLGDK